MSSIPALQQFVAQRRVGGGQAQLQQQTPAQQPAGLATPQKGAAKTRVLPETKTAQRQQKAAQRQQKAAQRQADQQTQRAQRERAQAERAQQKAGQERQQREEKQTQAIGSHLFKGRPKWLKPIQARLAFLPDLGSPWLPFGILLSFLFFLVPYGSQHKTRAQLLYDVVVGDAGIGYFGPTETGPGSGTGTGTVTIGPVTIPAGGAS